VGRRDPGAHQGGKWEFPGGKVETGESEEDALRREIAEETGFSFEEAALLHKEEHRYPDRTVILSFFLCLGLSPRPTPREKSRPRGGRPEDGLGGSVPWRWVSAQELRALEMPPANRRVLEIVADQLDSGPEGLTSRERG